MNSSVPFNIIILLLHFCTLSISGLRRQEITFYTHSNYTGQSVTFYENEPDLQANSEVGRIAKSVCVKYGLWVVAGIINGESSFNGWTSANIGVVCSTWNIREQTAIYLSVRRVTGSDLGRSSLSLYSEPNFRGTEIHIDDSMDFQLENSSVPVESVAFTGTRHWDLFSEKDFAGQANCMEAQKLGSYPMDVSFYTREQLSVGSLKMDCHRRSPQIPSFITSEGFTITVHNNKQEQRNEQFSRSSEIIEFSTNFGTHLVGNTQMKATSSVNKELPIFYYPVQSVVAHEYK